MDRYFESPPGLQFLHVLANNTTGGSSIFLDSHTAVEILRQESPESFKALCSTPVTFEYINDNHSLTYTRPTISDAPLKVTLFQMVSIILGFLLSAVSRATA